MKKFKCSKKYNYFAFSYIKSYCCGAERDFVMFMLFFNRNLLRFRLSSYFKFTHIVREHIFHQKSSLKRRILLKNRCH